MSELYQSHWFVTGWNVKFRTHILGRGILRIILNQVDFICTKAYFLKLRFYFAGTPEYRYSLLLLPVYTGSWSDGNLRYRVHCQTTTVRVILLSTGSEKLQRVVYILYLREFRSCRPTTNTISSPPISNQYPDAFRVSTVSHRSGTDVRSHAYIYCCSNNILYFSISSTRVKKGKVSPFLGDTQNKSERSHSIQFDRRIFVFCFWLVLCHHSKYQQQE